MALDDDNGTLIDGSPHGTAIRAAFARHNISRPMIVAFNGGCPGGPTAVQNLLVLGGTLQNSLTWDAVPGATEYLVMRSDVLGNEGAAACDVGRAIIARPTTPYYTDPINADGRRYFYTVTAVGTSEACLSPSSACYCGTVFAGSPPGDKVASSDFQTIWGSIFSGTYLNTQTSDNNYEVLQEALVGGVSKLRKDWKFTNVPDGCLSLNFEGNRTTSDGDNFKFEWAPDVNGAPGTFYDIPGADISKMFERDGGNTVSFTGPAAGSTIYIRIEDTNQMSGTSLDKVKVDRIAILPR